jgi:hypothetical protein
MASSKGKDEAWLSPVIDMAQGFEPSEPLGPQSQGSIRSAHNRNMTQVKAAASALGQCWFEPVPERGKQGG